MRYLSLSSFLALGLAVGCGNSNQAAESTAATNNRETLATATGSTARAVGATDAGVIDDSAFEAVVAEKEFSDRSNAPECLALRGEINVLRPALLAKTEWLSLVKTQAWDTLKTDYTAYTDASCPAITQAPSAISQSCANARAQVIADWTKVQASSEYQVVQKHDALASLVDKWDRAITADCISH